MSAMYEYLKEIKNKYDLSGKHPSIIAFAHEDGDYDRWALIVSGQGITNSKKSMDEAYEFVLSSLNGNLPKLIRSIYTADPGSEIIVNLTDYLSNFKNDDPSTMKQINQFGINDGFFILENELKAI